VIAASGYAVSCSLRNSRSFRYAVRPSEGEGKVSVASGSQRSLRSVAGIVFLPRLGSWRREALFCGEGGGWLVGFGGVGVGDWGGEGEGRVRLGRGLGSR